MPDFVRTDDLYSLFLLVASARFKGESLVSSTELVL